MSDARPILIAGPTAGGKSAIAARLARELGGIVINADSMQVYRDLRILTARPTAEEEVGAPHALYGFVVMAGADLGTSTHFAYRNSLLYTLQRITGVVAFVFIAWHVYSLRLSFYFRHLEIDYALMHGILGSPGWFGFYVLGVTSAIFHFCNGIFTFCITWGITGSSSCWRPAPS